MLLDFSAATGCPFNHLSDQKREEPLALATQAANLPSPGAAPATTTSPTSSGHQIRDPHSPPPPPPSPTSSFLPAALHEQIKKSLCCCCPPPAHPGRSVTGLPFRCRHSLELHCHRAPEIRHHRPGAPPFVDVRGGHARSLSSRPLAHGFLDAGHGRSGSSMPSRMHLVPAMEARVPATRVARGPASRSEAPPQALIESFFPHILPNTLPKKKARVVSLERNQCCDQKLVIKNRPHKSSFKVVRDMLTKKWIIVKKHKQLGS